MSLFITLEGIEGAGKSSLQQAFADCATAAGFEVVSTREPGATTLGQEIRELLLNPANTSLAPLAELALFAADRAQHVSEVIRPALARGAVVVCDRYTHSTLAYQGFGRELDLTTIKQLNALVTDGLQPDCVFLFDLPVDQGLQRASRRTAETSPCDTPANEHSWSRFEEQELLFHQRVRQGYLALANEEPSRFEIIDASKSLAEVKADALAAFRGRLSRQQ